METAAFKPAMSIADAIKRDEEFWEITKGLPIPLVPGSLFRINERYLPSWGIEVTPENRGDLRKRSRAFCLKDETEVGVQIDADLLLTTQSRSDAEMQMAMLMGSIAASIISAKSRYNDELTLCDLGARNGKATATAIHEIKKLDGGLGLIDRTRFHLIESTVQRSEAIEKRLMWLGINGWEIHTAREGAATDCEALLKRMPGESMDVIITLAEMHHHAFPDYIADMLRVLKPGGMLVSGDWYSAAWQNPVFTLYLLDNMFGLDKSRISRFMDFFNLTEDNRVSVISSPDIYIKPGIFEMIDQFRYWNEIREKMAKLKSECRNPIRRYFLGGHTTLQERKQDLLNAGFIVDSSEIRKAFPGIVPKLPKQIRPPSNFGVVMAAMKPGRGNGGA